MALGASRGQILDRSSFREWRLPAEACLGAAAAVFATRVLQNFVWGVSTLDPLTFIAVVCCWSPSCGREPGSGGARGSAESGEGAEGGLGVVTRSPSTTPESSRVTPA